MCSPFPEISRGQHSNPNRPEVAPKNKALPRKRKQVRSERRSHPDQVRQVAPIIVIIIMPHKFIQTAEVRRMISDVVFGIVRWLLDIFRIVRWLLDIFCHLFTLFSAQVANTIASHISNP